VFLLVLVIENKKIDYKKEPANDPNEGVFTILPTKHTKRRQNFRDGLFSFVSFVRFVGTSREGDFDRLRARGGTVATTTP
jgi:hypothetical protein